ncbi:putative membrane protein [Rhodopirellula sallentina SM41]|uniref:Putative membrane protein n=2 Tax=Rhodopirellula TaxID=265488 RepID=M5U7Z5_9BACT|nr:putative membrane protein [Rhodopirellula sallentina SM41]
MSSFLTIGLFFVFRRFWSIRNLDILLLILLAPGLLMVNEGYRRQTRLDRELVQTLAQQRSAGESLSIEDSTSSQEKTKPGASGSDQAAPVQTSVRGSEPFPNDSSEPAGDAELFGDAALGDAELLRDSDAPNESGGQTLVSQSQDSAPAPDPTALDTAPALDAHQSAEVADPRTPEQIAAYDSATSMRRNGFIWLFVIEMGLMIRMLLDPLMVRRPLLDPNLTTGGLNFLGISLFIFMMANVVASTPEIQREQGPELGPGYALMNMLPTIPVRPISEVIGGAEPPTLDELSPAQQSRAAIAKIIAIISQSAILIGILLIGNRHFGNLRAGAGCATLYLLMPYTAQMTGRVDHVVPAALLLWAILLYRKPFFSGLFVGAAAGLVYYPFFLLPLWFSFYWQRGARRFAIGVLSMIGVLMALLVLDGTEPFFEHLRQMFGLFFPTQDPRGVWELGWNPVWRLPVIVAFVILSIFLAIWPAQKNLGILISCSAALMIAAQFWHGYGGGLYMGWFLPLLLLTIFRPNLQDRIALKVIDAAATSPPRAPAQMDAA